MESTWSIGSIGYVGGADTTFACKSQEWLWQDWYIYLKKRIRFEKTLPVSSLAGPRLEEVNEMAQ